MKHDSGANIPARMAKPVNHAPRHPAPAMTPNQGTPPRFGGKPHARSTGPVMPNATPPVMPGNEGQAMPPGSDNDADDTMGAGY